MSFHVPEKFRVKTGPMRSDKSYGNNGAFLVSSLKLKRRLQVICSDQEGWEHVSVSIHDRMPTWEEMNFIKNLFWDEDEYIEKEKADPRACSFSISARSTYIFSNL